MADEQIFFLHLIIVREFCECIRRMLRNDVSMSIAIKIPLLKCLKPFLYLTQTVHFTDKTVIHQTHILTVTLKDLPKSGLHAETKIQLCCLYSIQNLPVEFQVPGGTEWISCVFFAGMISSCPCLIPHSFQDELLWWPFLLVKAVKYI